MWFSGSKKSANTIFNLLPNYANIAQSQSNLVPQSCLNPSKTLSQKTYSFLAKPGFLCMLHNSYRALGIEDNNSRVLGIEDNISRVLGIKDNSSRVLGIEDNSSRVLGIVNSNSRVFGIENNSYRVLGIENNSSKVLGIVNSNSGVLGIEDNSPRVLGIANSNSGVQGIEDNSFRVLGFVNSSSRVMGIAHDPWNKIVSYQLRFWFRRVHSLSGKGLKNENGIEDAQKFSDFDSDEEDESGFGERKSEEGFIRNVERIVSILDEHKGFRLALKDCELVPSSELVEEVMSRIGSDWVKAYAVFMWAGSYPGYCHSLSAYHDMISILGKYKKFDLAWDLIRKMQGRKNKSNNVSMVTFETLLIMMKRYSAVNDVAGAIKSFQMLERFKLKADVNAFHALLSVLCRYKNVEDAELLLYYKKSAFGYDTESFNIVLNGWCNMIVSITRAKRFWKVMINNGINPDARSFSCMICCFSKAGKVHDVLRLFDEMKKRNYAPDLKVYNAVFHALAERKFFKEAYNILNVLEEKGFTPNTLTYNSLIKAFCKAERLEDAYMVFDEMIQKGLEPSITTFHAIFRALKDPKEVMELFDRMIKSNCSPTMETFIMLIRKFCCWHDYSNMVKVWNIMSKHGCTPDRSAYIVLIQGLFLNGKLEEAHKYYEEMKVQGFSDEPMFDKMIGTWIEGRELAAPQLLKLKEEKAQESLKRKKIYNTVSSGMPRQRLGRESNRREDFDWTELQKMDKITRKKNYGF